MNKLLIAAALVASSVSAFAQSNVQVYGIMDAAGVYQSNSAGKNTNSISSGGLQGSRIGFKGTEEIGNGISAFFTIEEGFSLDTNATTLTARQTFVGVKSNAAGALSLGRQYSPGYNASFEYDPLAGSPFGAQQVLSAVAGYTIAASETGRWNNTVNYVAPTFVGITPTFMYRTGEQVNVAGVSDRTTLEGYAAGLKYKAGNFATSYVYQFTETSTNGTAPTAGLNGGQQRENFIGASYDFGGAKLLGSYQTSNWDKNGQSKGSDTQLYNVGVVVPVGGKFDIHTAYSYLDVNGATAGAGGNAQSATLAGIYKMSKRTRLYALAGYTEFDSGLKTSTYTGVNASPVAAASPLVTTANDGYTLAAGINHAF